MARTREMSPANSTEQSEQPKEEKKQKSRRPPNTAFRQQRLKAWQPILTPKTVLPLFFIVGIVFAPLGGLLLWASTTVQELSINYTDCFKQAPLVPAPAATIPTNRVRSSFTSSTPSSEQPTWLRSHFNKPYGNPRAKYTYNTTQCTLEFYVPNNIGPPVYMYYRLTNFYQNHRRYVKSIDQAQLKGDFVPNATIAGSDCGPLDWDGTKAYYPCGLIANSLFNDTILEPVWLNPPTGDTRVMNETYAMTNSSIAWSSDAQIYGPTKYTPLDVVPPPHWINRYPHGYNEDFPLPDLHHDDAFQVWMRTAGLPTFSKLSRKNETDPMQKGRYQLTIHDDFDVSVYGGTKEILFSTRTVIGGKNPFLGIAYIVVGGVCVLLGAIFTATHLIKPRKLGDHTYLSWNNEQPSTATATGRSLQRGDPT